MGQDGMGFTSPSPVPTALDASDAITDAIIVLLYHRRAWPLFAASVTKQQESILLRPHNGSLTLDLSFTLKLALPLLQEAHLPLHGRTALPLEGI
ncbi:hypothetical protein WN943_027129 [Citrus x changshan-huyou]